MNQKSLQQHIWQRYGLRFITEPSGQLVLRLREGSPAFAVYDPQQSSLAVKCPKFATALKKLPHFQAVGSQDPDWVEMAIDSLPDKDINDVLDYGFKSASNGSINFVTQQLTFLPATNVDEQYHSQKIPTPKNGHHVVRHRPRQQAPKLLAKMMAAYDYTVLPADERAYNFYHQGRMVENYQDDYNQLHELHHYYPDYHCMNVNQLRTYFSWRTQLRRGNFTVTSTSYAYVYIYELLNNLGVKDATDGFKKLRLFEKKYVSSYDQRMKTYLHQWLQDYVLYYGMPRQAANEMFKHEIANDRDYHIMRHPMDYPAQDLAEVFTRHCTYVNRCKLAKSAPGEWAQLVQCVWRRLMASPDDYFRQMVAAKTATSHYFFAGAVFYYRRSPRNQKYVVDSERTYLCDDRKYECQKWLPLKKQNQRLNVLFHEVDRLTRQRLHLGHPLKPRSEDAKLLNIIHAGISDYQKLREEESRPKININMADLGQIRADASVTRESLLTDEEKDDHETSAEMESIKPQIPNDDSDEKITTDQADPSDAGLPEDDEEEVPQLSQDESYMMNALLKGNSYENYLRKHHLMASILVDSINEKLMDVFGDTVIGYNEAGKPIIIDDYRKDCADMYLPKEDQ